MKSHINSKHQTTIEQLNRDDVEVALKWAQNEGWNPGIHDAECFFQADPEGFYAAKINGEIVGTISLVKYSENFVFEGLYIAKPEFRGKGIGSLLQRFALDICKDSNLGLDGVVQMQKKYEQSGFAFAHHNTRYAGILTGSPSDRCLHITKEDFDELVAFDTRFFPAMRRKFLECWLSQKGSSAFMVRNEETDAISGYGVIRKCFRGHKIGPLFAEDDNVADALFNSLVSTVPQEEIYLDVPEPNRAAVKLAQKNHMQPVFSTVRMYTKTAPVLPLDRIYGITTFELG